MYYIQHSVGREYPTMHPHTLEDPINHPSTLITSTMFPTILRIYHYSLLYTPKHSASPTMYPNLFSPFHYGPSYTKYTPACTPINQTFHTTHPYTTSTPINKAQTTMYPNTHRLPHHAPPYTLCPIIHPFTLCILYCAPPYTHHAPPHTPIDSI